MPKKTKEESIQDIANVKAFLNADLDKLSTEEKATVVSGVRDIVEKLNAEKSAEWDSKVSISEDDSIKEIYSLIKEASAGLKAVVKKRGSISNGTGN